MGIWPQACCKVKKKHQSSCISDFSKQVILQPFSSHYLLSAGASGAWKAPLSFVRWSADFIKRKEVLPEKAAKWLLAGRAQQRMTVRNNMQFSDTKWLTGGIVLSYYKPNVYTRLQSGVLSGFLLRLNIQHIINCTSTSKTTHSPLKTSLRDVPFSNGLMWPHFVTHWMSFIWSSRWLQLTVAGEFHWVVGPKSSYSKIKVKIMSNIPQ